MRHYKYILNAAGEPEPCEDLTTWARWFEDFSQRQIAIDRVNDYRISTVFLGLDLSFGFGPPILFETMVFDKNDDHVPEFTKRYTTRAAALDGHTGILAAFLGYTGPAPRSQS